jgi:hypothetical protein
MSCKRYKDALLESVVSAEVPDDALANHLRSCPGCQEILQSQQDVLSKVEDVLRLRMTEEPPIGFLTRVQAEISQQGIPYVRWNPAWALAVAAAVLVLISIPRMSTGPREAIQAAKRGSTASATQRSKASLSGRESLAKSGNRVRTRARVATLTTSQPAQNQHAEVLVPPDEAKAFRQFIVRLAESREVAQAFVNGEASEYDALPEISPVEIADLRRLEPLVWEKWK